MMSISPQPFVSLKLEVFEGPLDLLLHLIKKADLEISLVSISRIADQYIDYLNAMQELNIDFAGEFLVMASELAHLKSKSLLPHTDIEESEDETEQVDLVSKLKQYHLYKCAAEFIKSRPQLGRDVFKRGSVRFHEDDTVEVGAQDNKPEAAYDVDAFDLVRALGEILKRMPPEERTHKIEAERVSVSERIYEILECFNSRESLLFSELFSEAKTRSEVIVSFLAILEMTRLKLLRIYQTGVFEPIRLMKNIELIDDVEINAKVIDDFH